MMVALTYSHYALTIALTYSLTVRERERERERKSVTLVITISFGFRAKKNIIDSDCAPIRTRKTILGHPRTGYDTTIVDNDQRNTNTHTHTLTHKPNIWQRKYIRRGVLWSSRFYSNNLISSTLVFFKKWANSGLFLVYFRLYHMVQL